MIDTIFRQLRIIGAFWWIAICITAVVLFTLRHKNRYQVFGNILIVYLMIVFVSTVVSRTAVRNVTRVDLVNLHLLGTWIERFSRTSPLRAELILNFFMLLPIGILFPLSTGKSFLPTVALGLLVTFVIESLQLLTGRGWFELSDIVDNTAGVAIGYGCYYIGKALRRRFAQ